MTTNWLILGKVGRPHGLRGAMVIHWSSAPEPWLFALRKVALRRQGQDWCGMDVVHWRPLDSHKTLLECPEITTCEQARLFLAAQVAFDRSWLPALPEKEWYLVDTIGAQVVDQHQRCLGEVVRFVDGAAHPFAIVQDGQEEHYLPLVPQWICRFARQEKQLHVQLPEGLFGNKG